LAYGCQEWGPCGYVHLTTNRAGRRGSDWKRDRWSLRLLLLLKEAIVTAILVAEVVVQLIQKALITFVVIIIIIIF
jgi:hypothetical protein